MINEIQIKNFKSVQDLTLPLGRFNVLIGANGSGKSNILEAIVFGGAASGDKLENEFIASRGIRATSAQLIESAFSQRKSPIYIKYLTENKEIPLTIEYEDSILQSWSIKQKEDILENLLNEKITTEIRQALEAEIVEIVNRITNKSKKKENLKKESNSQRTQDYISSIFEEAFHSFSKQSFDKEIANFIIYSPEESSLRKFEEESQILPIGRKGEGLFNVLQIFNEKYEKETLEEIKKYLHLIEWFDDFEAAYDTVSGRKYLTVKDRYLPGITLNQNNVNEGFLFLLFYISLFISKETPAFFAIDNIEASFHPKLCEELIKSLAELAKKHDKQVILTTHNPFVLDGLDLEDDEQRLFVVRRNGDGETIADRIDKHPKSVKLSEAWMRGYIGGNPETIY